MGHKQSRRSKNDAEETSPSQGPANPSGDSSVKEKEKKPYRYEDHSKIKPVLVQGPFEDFEIAQDVYATAYLIARNACPEMYSFSPFKNPQVRIVWLYLLFVIFSQLYAILSITVIFPPSIKTDTTFVDCQNITSFASFHARGFLLGVDSSEDCREAGDNEIAFIAEAYGSPREFYKIEKQTMFYDAVLKDGSLFHYLLRMVCCAWVFAQAYFDSFENVSNLLDYHDFIFFFIETTGYTNSNRWTICFPLIQYSVLLVVTCVSFVMICSTPEAFDIVMNCLAFTFINEVGSYFNGALARQMGQREIQEGMNYLYPEYQVDNFENPDGSYTDEGWYISKEEKKIGLISDYIVRHNPDLYEHPSQKLAKILQNLLIGLPILSVIIGALRCHGDMLGQMMGAISGEL